MKKGIILATLLIATLSLSGCSKPTTAEKYQETMLLHVDNSNRGALFNTDGKIIASEGYRFLSWPKNGLAVVEDDNLKYGIMNDKGQFAVKLGDYSNIEDVDDNFIVQKDHKYGLINNKGKVILDIKFNYMTKDNGLTGRAFCIIAELDGKKGLYTSDGEKILDNKYKEMDIDEMEAFGNTTIARADNENYLVNIKNGKILKKVSKDTHVYISEYAIDKDAGKIIVYNDDTGELLFELPESKYKNVINDATECGYVTASEKNGEDEYDTKSVTFNSKGKLLDVNGESKEMVEGKNVAVISNYDNQVYFFNGSKKGKVVSGYELSRSLPYKSSKFNVGMRNVSTNKYDMFNQNGDKITTTPYDFLSVLNNDYAIVGYDDDKYGVIDSKGHEITKEKFNEIQQIGHSDYFSVQKTKDGKYGIMDSKGDIILNCDYDKVAGYSILNVDAWGKVVEVEKNTKKGVFNLKDKKIILEPKYEGRVELSQNPDYIKIGNEYYNYDGKLIYTGKKQ